MALALDLNLFNNDLIISSGERFLEIVNSFFNPEEAENCVAKSIESDVVTTSAVNVDEVVSNMTGWITNAGNMEYETCGAEMSKINDIILCFHY